MADSPSEYTNYYSLRKWAEHVNPGATGLNANWDDIDNLLHNMLDLRGTGSGIPAKETQELSGSLIIDGVLHINNIIEKDTDTGVTIEGILLKDTRIHNLISPTDNDEPATKEYVDQLAQGVDWQVSVLDKDILDPSSLTPSTGDRYLIDGTGAGDWTGHDKEIAEWDGSAWLFGTPNEGWTVNVEDENKYYTYNGTNWFLMASMFSHNQLAGLQGGTTNEYYHLTADEHSNLLGTVFDVVITTQAKFDDYFGTSGTKTVPRGTRIYIKSNPTDGTIEHYKYDATNFNIKAYTLNAEVLLKGENVIAGSGIDETIIIKGNNDAQITTNYLVTKSGCSNNADSNVISLTDTTDLKIGQSMFYDGDSDFYEIRDISANVSITVDKNIDSAYSTKSIYVLTENIEISNLTIDGRGGVNGLGGSMTHRPFTLNYCGNSKFIGKVLNGYIDGSGGGGLYLLNSSNNTISNVSNNYSYGVGGGGMYLLNSSNNTISNVSNNYSNYGSGGGGLNFNNSSNNTISNVSNNYSSHGDGGGLYLQNSSNNNTISNVNGNSAGLDGGGVNVTSTSLRNIIYGVENNTAGGIGDNIYLGSNSSNNTILKNTATDWATWLKDNGGNSAIVDGMNALASLKIDAVVDDTSPQLGGELDAQAHSIGFTLQTHTGVVGTTTINWQNGNKAKFTFGAGNETLAFTASSKPCNLVLIVIQDSTGGRTITWPSLAKWAGGSAPTLSTAANAIDVISFFWTGNEYLGVASLNFS